MARHMGGTERDCAGQLDNVRHTKAHLGLGSGPRLFLEFVGEWLVVEEGPWVVELVVPRPLEIFHRLDELAKLLVANERQ